MRLEVRHTQTFRFDPPALATIQIARMAPRDHTGQYVCDWTFELSGDVSVDHGADAYGNTTHAFSVMGPVEDLTLSAFGEVETEDHSGVVRGAVDPVPHGVFLRETELTMQGSLARQLAEHAKAAGAEPLERLHAMMGHLHQALPEPLRLAAPENETQSQSQSQTGAFEHLVADLDGREAVADQFVAAARLLGLPARCVSGYVLAEEPATHVEIWAEAFIDRLGWVGFDPARDICPAGNSVRLAVGLDSLGVAPVRAGHYGQSKVEEDVTISVRALRT